MATEIRVSGSVTVCITSIQRPKEESRELPHSRVARTAFGKSLRPERHFTGATGLSSSVEPSLNLDDRLVLNGDIEYL
jgi:hypothetical protein